METTRIDLPTKVSIGKIAENQPQLLNLLLAYFVFEWRQVRAGNPSHGIDQLGVSKLIPDYVEMWTDSERDGVDTAVHLLLNCPKGRTIDEPGYLSEWLAKVSQ